VKTIAVTGARGLLGSTVVRVLGASAIEADVRDADALKAEIRKLSGVSWLVHAAAKTDVGACERDPEEAYTVNAGGTKNVVEAARACGARLLYISTASVFSGGSGNYREDDVPEPINVYNKTKAEGEKHVLAYEKGTALRLNLIGVHPDGSRGKNFMEWLADSFGADKDINAFDDVMINPLSNWTVAGIIKTIAERNVQERILHIGSGDVRSKADIAEMVASQFQEYKGKITRTSVDTIADGIVRPKQTWINCDYTKERLALTMPSIESEVETIFARMV